MKKKIPMRLLCAMLIIFTTLSLLNAKDKKKSKKIKERTATEKERKVKSKEKLVTVDEITIKNADNSIYGKLYKSATGFSATAANKSPLVIFSHDLDGKSDSFSGTCKYLATNGYLCYAYDFCGGSTHSKSTGLSTDMTLFSEKSDLLAVYNYFLSRDEVDTNNIFLIGREEGAVVSALVAQELSDKIRALVLYSPTLSLSDNIKKTYPDKSTIPNVVISHDLQLGKNYFDTLYDFNIMDNITNYKNQVLIIHGDSDNTTPLTYAQDAAAKYAAATIIVLAGDDHSYSDSNKDLVRENTFQFLQTNLQK